MELLIQGGKIYDEGILRDADVLVKDGVIAKIEPGLPVGAGTEVLPAKGCVISPGFTDLHVHLRQPGFEAKETIASGTAAGAAGGYTTVCAMPNLNPVPDNLQNLQPQLAAIEADAKIRVLPYGALTVEEKGGCLADIAVLSSFVAGFSDDGRGVQDEGMMRRAMAAVAEAGSFVTAHCEVEALLPEGCVTVQEGSRFAARHGYTGVSEESEWAEVERDIKLAEETGCRLNICHTSTAKSFALVREAKWRGLPVTCEVTPHNLLLCADDIDEDDGRFKMNPPLRTEESRKAAIAALLDGTIDAIATDHAPHTEEDKTGGFARAMNGVVGLETAFASLYTKLVLPGTLPLERLLHLLTAGPAELLGERTPVLAPGIAANLTVLDVASEKTVEPEKFETKGRATPFKGWRLRGWPVLTLYKGQVVWRA